MPPNIRLFSTLLFVCAMPILALTPQISKRWHATESQPIRVVSASDRLQTVSQVTSSAEQVPNTPEPGELPPPSPKSTASDKLADFQVRRLPPTNITIENDRFTSIQARLQDLGVDYFVLERADAVTDHSEPLFRFHCRIRVPGSRIYLRPFEAQNRDPLQAMELVLRDVEQWTAKRDGALKVR